MSCSCPPEARVCKEDIADSDEKRARQRVSTSVEVAGSSMSLCNLHLPHKFVRQPQFTTNPTEGPALKYFECPGEAKFDLSSSDAYDALLEALMDPSIWDENPSDGQVSVTI